MRVTAAGGIVVAAASASGVQTTLLILGAIVFALASWRRDTRNVLRQQNLDLAERNQTLEADLHRSKALIDSLSNQPNLEQHAALLGKLLEMDQKVLEMMGVLSKNVETNTEAVRYWTADLRRETSD